MLNNYKNYLNFLDRKLGEFFERQKPFIFCKRGCSYCCKKSEFPYSLLEMQYLLSSLPTLSEETLCKIEENLQNLFESIRKTGLFIHADFWLSENIDSHLKKLEDVHFKGSRYQIGSFSCYIK